MTKLKRYVTRATPGDSSGDSDSTSDSESDSEDGATSVPKRPKVEDLSIDDDEDGGAVVSPDQVRTKNEAAEVQVIIPEVEQIEENEAMEKVGEVLSIVDKVVIVQGLSRQAQGRVSDRALDCDTLLVFEDRRVLGYVSIFHCHRPQTGTQRILLRSGKRLVQPASHFTGYSSTKHILWTPRKYGWAVMSTMSRREASSSPSAT